MINLTAFLIVAGASLLAAAVVVSLYSLGLRLLTSAGRIPMVDPAEFTGAITILTPAQAEKEARRARKARKANPLTAGQKRAALIVKVDQAAPVKPQDHVRNPALRVFVRQHLRLVVHAAQPLRKGMGDV